MPDIDFSSLLAERLLGITLDVLLEAFGVTAIITLLVRKFTDKINSYRDVLFFCVLMFLISIIAISTFGYQRPRPEINIDINMIATGIGSPDDKDTTVIVLGTLVNRGNSPTVIMKYDLSAYLSGQTYKGAPFTLPSPMIIHLDKDRVETITPQNEIFNRPPERPLVTGVPVTGFMIYKIKNQPWPNFATKVEYTIKLTDSFGYTYTATKETHGEFSLEPHP